MAISLMLVAPPTDEDVRTLSARNPGYQFERTASGELVVTATGARSGQHEAELIIQLGNWAKADGTGIVYSSQTGFLLPDGSLFLPDASWVQRKRWDALTPQEQENFAPLCPDAVFEFASPSDALPHLRRKSQNYVANGARLVVLIDPKHQAVETFGPSQPPRVLENVRSVALGPVLPGFVLDLDALFGG